MFFPDPSSPIKVRQNCTLRVVSFHPFVTDNIWFIFPIPENVFSISDLSCKLYFHQNFLPIFYFWNLEFIIFCRTVPMEFLQKKRWGSNLKSFNLIQASFFQTIQIYSTLGKLLKQKSQYNIMIILQKGASWMLSK